MEIIIYTKDGSKFKCACDSYLLNEAKDTITMYKHKRSTAGYANIKIPTAYFRLTEIIGLYFMEIEKEEGKNNED